MDQNLKNLIETVFYLLKNDDVTKDAKQYNTLNYVRGNAEEYYELVYSRSANTFNGMITLYRSSDANAEEELIMSLKTFNYTLAELVEIIQVAIKNL